MDRSPVWIRFRTVDLPVVDATLQEFEERYDDVVYGDGWIKYEWDDAAGGLGEILEQLAACRVTLRGWVGSCSGSWDEASVVAHGGVMYEQTESTTGGLLLPVQSDGSISAPALDNLANYIRVRAVVDPLLGFNPAP